MIWDEAAQEEYDATTHCHTCEKELDRSGETPARDHCHLTGLFRGDSHEHCNLEYKTEKEIYKLPVIFYNLRMMHLSSSSRWNGNMERLTLFLTHFIYCRTIEIS